jgi:ribosome-binding protein aMBF1 (putative translation factor)
MNTIEQQRIDFKNLLNPRTSDEKIEQEAMMLAAQFLHDISRTMEARNMRLKDLAELLGVSKSYVTQIFRGDKLPNFKFMAKVQMMLDVKFKVSVTLNPEAPARSPKKTIVSM